MSDLLFRLAIQAQTDPSAIPVLGDALIEAGEVERLKPFVMALLIGVPLHDDIPERHQFRGEQARHTYRQKRRQSLEDAQKFWPQYASANSPVWARAVLAVLLFREWRPATVPTQGNYLIRTRSPWALMREPANRSNRENLAALRDAEDARNREREARGPLPPPW